jgi:UDP-galactopyranose mutase
MPPEFLIVGSGLTGATIARTLADNGRSVLVLERRPFLGGNVADTLHPCGVHMSRYGPHYFRTSSSATWAFVNRFAAFRPFEAVVQSRVRGRCENWPVAASYIRRTVGASWSPEFRGAPTNFEEAALALMPRAIYEDFVRGYTEKQWGRPAHALAADLCRRFDVRADDNPRLTPDRRVQGLPSRGYSDMIEQMLAGIPVRLNCDFLRRRDEFRWRELLVFTGPIDAFFDNALGRLAYRGQHRATTYLPDTRWALPCGQVNEPAADVPHIRTIEWKHMLPAAEADRIAGTLLTTECPCTPTAPDDYEYPFPDEPNRRLYERYRALADRDSNVLICGRLGEYRYYDMDQAIERAQSLARQILTTERPAHEFADAIR